MSTRPGTAMLLGVAALLVAVTIAALGLDRTDPVQLQWQQFVLDICGTECNVSAVGLAEDGDGDRTVRAARRLSEGEEVIAVPRAIVLTARDVLPMPSEEVAAASQMHQLALGLVGVASGAAVAASVSPSHRATALRWLAYNLPHAPEASFGLLDPALAAAIDAVDWLRATSHSADGWPGFAALVRSQLSEVDDRLARTVFAAVSSRAFEQPLR